MDAELGIGRVYDSVDAHNAGGWFDGAESRMARLVALAARAQQAADAAAVASPDAAAFAARLSAAVDSGKPADVEAIADMLEAVLVASRAVDPAVVRSVLWSGERYRAQWVTRDGFWFDAPQYLAGSKIANIERFVTREKMAA